MCLRVESVADAPNGGDLLSEFAQLLTQPPDVVIHRSVDALEVTTPYPLDQEFTVERTSRIGCKQVEQLKLLRRQGKVVPVEGCAVRARLDAEGAVHDDLFVRSHRGARLATFCLELHAPKGGAGARQQLAHAKGLDEVVVSADL